MILSSEKLELLPVTEADLDMMCRWRNRAENYDHFFEWEPITPERQRRWFEEQLRNNCERNFIIWQKPKDAIGTISLVNIDYRNRKAEFGRFFIDEPYRGKGMGKKALQILHDYAFNHLNLRKLYCEVLASNSRAIRLYEEVGYQICGTFKQHVYKDGAYVDVVRMELFKGDLNE